MLRELANFQFYPGAGNFLFPEGIVLKYSRYLGRPRGVYLNGSLIATLGPKTGLLILTKKGGELLKRGIPPPRLRVVISKNAEIKVLEGMSVFSKFVIDIDPELRIGDEVLVTNEKDELIATGKLVLAPHEIKYFKRGIAVKVRGH
ncbi:MAG: PUA domain-containing protein [Thermoproteota archaeon]